MNTRLTRRILVVDDSFALRAQVRAELESHGVTVMEAENGVEGLWHARENSFDLFLVDVHMPIMDGLRMVEELRKLPQYSQTPVFILTSDVSPARIELGKKVGANAWILKPVQLDVLWKGIDRALFGKASTPGLVSRSAGREDK